MDRPGAEPGITNGQWSMADGKSIHGFPARGAGLGGVIEWVTRLEVGQESKAIIVRLLLGLTYRTLLPGKCRRPSKDNWSTAQPSL